MNNSKQLLAIARNCQRHFSKTAKANASEAVNPRIQRVREKQQLFQVDDGTPVYLKGGFGDKALYAATLALTAIGMGMSLEVFYKITFK